MFFGSRGYPNTSQYDVDVTFVPRSYKRKGNWCRYHMHISAYRNFHQYWQHFHLFQNTSWTSTSPLLLLTSLALNCLNTLILFPVQIGALEAIKQAKDDQGDRTKKLRKRFGMFHGISMLVNMAAMALNGVFVGMAQELWLELAHVKTQREIHVDYIAFGSIFIQEYIW